MPDYSELDFRSARFLALELASKHASASDSVEDVLEKAKSIVEYISSPFKLATQKPKPTRYLPYESSLWTNWNKGGHRQAQVHAIMFDDGSIFDTVNGWRETL